MAIFPAATTENAEGTRKNNTINGAARIARTHTKKAVGTAWQKMPSAGGIQNLPPIEGAGKKHVLGPKSYSALNIGAGMRGAITTREALRLEFEPQDG